jgi:hypothetical protein
MKIKMTRSGIVAFLAGFITCSAAEVSSAR